MFCTVDSKQARFFRLYLVTEEGNTIPADLPISISKEISKLKAIPTLDGLHEIVTKISKITWVDRNVQKSKLHQMLDADSLIGKTNSSNESIIKLKAINKYDEVPSQDEVVVISEIVLEFWRYKFDRGDNRIIARKYNTFYKSISN